MFSKAVMWTDDLCHSGVQIKSSAGSGANNMGLVAEDVTAPAKEAATEAVKAAGKL